MDSYWALEKGIDIVSLKQALVIISACFYFFVNKNNIYVHMKILVLQLLIVLK